MGLKIKTGSFWTKNPGTSKIKKNGTPDPRCYPLGGPIGKASLEDFSANMHVLLQGQKDLGHWVHLFWTPLGSILVGAHFGPHFFVSMLDLFGTFRVPPYLPVRPHGSKIGLSLVSP